MRRTPPQTPRRVRGITLIEALVAMLVLVFGMLGTAGMLVRAQQAEFESYQRKQALMLIEDIVARLKANRPVADDCYAVTTDTSSGTPYLGTGNTIAFGCTAGSAAQQARAVADLQQFEAALLGAGETVGATNVGALVGARGCISVTGDDAVGFTFTVSIAWQGTVETGAPPAAATCGKDMYGNESLRRVATVTVYVPNLGAV